MIKNDTKTFLGFIDEPIQEVTQPEPVRDLRDSSSSSIDDDYDFCDDIYPYSTKIGGAPIWCAQPPAHLKNIKCATCGNYLTFLMQAYCPLNSLPDYERNFYIFVCPLSTCNSTKRGWKIVKCLDPLKENELPEEGKEDLHDEHHRHHLHCHSNDGNIESNGNHVEEEDEEDDDWGVGGGADDWGISTTATPSSDTRSIDELIQLRDLALKKEKENIKLNKNNNNSNNNNNNNNNFDDQSASDGEIISGVQLNDDKSNQLKAYSLSIEEESVYVKSNNNNNNEDLIKKYSHHDLSDDPVESDWSSETYEYVKDRIFNKFLKKISAAPSQCLRYSYNGAPLCFSQEGLKLTVQPPVCNRCNMNKVFEFQILSTIIPQITPHAHILAQYQQASSIINTATANNNNTTTTTNSNNNNTTNNNNNSNNNNTTPVPQYQLEFGNAFIYSCPSNCFDKSDIINDVIYTEESIVIEKSV